jgi:hypothetical protein
MFDRILRWRPRHAKKPTRIRHRHRIRPLAVEFVEDRLLLAAPEISVLNGGAEIVSGTTIPIDFGNVTQGVAGTTRTFSISNDGDDTLTISNISLPTGFSLVDGIYPTIAERGSDTFTIRLDSTTVGAKTGQISFSNNDDDENPFSFAITGTVLAGGPEITVLVGAANVADGSVAAVDFGNVLLGQVGPTRTFTVRNDGSQPLTLGSISLPTGFVLTDALPTSLAPFTSDSFSVQLSTTGLGVKTGEISFATNDADENPFNFAVTGIVNPVQVPEITVLDGFMTILDGSLVPIDFGVGTIGMTAPTRTFTVRNDGNNTLTLGAVTLPAGFSLVEGLAASLTPRAIDTFTVQLDISAVGVPAGEISISTNDGDESPFNFPIAGTVVNPAPEIRVFREDFVELFDGAVPASEFLTSNQGQTGSRLAFLVHNLGTAPLVVSTLTLPAGFVLDGDPLPSIAPGENAVFSVVLNTTTVGVMAGNIELANNDADENPFEIPITGTVVGSAPEITVLQGNANVVDGGAAPLPFGDGVLREPGSRQVITVRNDGNVELALGDITLPDRFTLIEGLVSTLAPGDSDTFTVLLDTSIVGSFGGEITISNNDADENPFNFTIAAAVTATPVPEITVVNGGGLITNGDSTPIDFGNVVRRQKGVRRTFTIRNDGSDTLRIGRIELPTGFSLVKGPRRNLAPRGTDTIIVQLDSKKLGTKSGLVRIQSNDAGEDPFSFAITGTVVE